MRPTPQLHCVVAYARSDRQFFWHVQLPGGATIADAIQAARETSGLQEVPWDSAEVGIFGERKTREAQVEEGDRIELYRPLTNDPRERRRKRARYGPGSG